MKEISLDIPEFADGPEIARLANNRNIWNFLLDRMPYPYAEKDAEDFITWVRSQTPIQHFVIKLGITVVGVIGLEIQEDVFKKSANLGYWLGTPYHNKGIMTQAVKLMCNYGFEKMDIVRIQAHVFDFNVASQRVLEKCGFEREAILKDACFKNGQICDDVIYSKLKRR